MSTCKIPIKNWLKYEKQRFYIEFEIEGDDPSVILKGGDNIDVNKSESKEYRLNILTHKPGN